MIQRSPVVLSGQRKLLQRILRHWQLYLLLLLPVAYVIIFDYIPMAGVQIAFRKYNIRKGIWNSNWLGIDNFLRFFSSYQFERTVTNTLALSFYSLIAGFPLPVILALGLNAMESKKYRNFIQNVIYIPHFLSIIVLIGLVNQIFNPRIGVYGILWGLFNEGYAPSLTGQADTFRHFYIWSGVWQNMGWGSILYFAALSGVDQTLHEAAEIDGASRFQRLLHVDIPHIIPTIAISLILRMGSIMSIGFEKAYMMQTKLNLPVSEVISTYVYKIAMASGTSDFSYSTAIGLFNSVINLSMLVIVNRISRRVSETSLW